MSVDGVDVLRRIGRRLVRLERRGARPPLLGEGLGAADVALVPHELRNQLLDQFDLAVRRVQVGDVGLVDFVPDLLPLVLELSALL